MSLVPGVPTCTELSHRRSAVWDPDTLRACDVSGIQPGVCEQYSQMCDPGSLQPQREAGKITELDLPLIASPSISSDICSFGAV